MKTLKIAALVIGLISVFAFVGCGSGDNVDNTGTEIVAPAPNPPSQETEVPGEDDIEIELPNDGDQSDDDEGAPPEEDSSADQDPALPGEGGESQLPETEPPLPEEPEQKPVEPSEEELAAEKISEILGQSFSFYDMDLSFSGEKYVEGKSFVAQIQTELSLSELAEKLKGNFEFSNDGGLDEKFVFDCDGENYLSIYKTLPDEDYGLLITKSSQNVFVISVTYTSWL